jgi:CHAT domain-containing protein
MADILNNLGTVYRDQGNYAEAMAYYQKSLSLREAVGKDNDIARSLTNIGILHMTQGNYAQALEHHRKSLERFESVGDKAGISGVLLNLGIVHILRSEIAQGLEVLHRGLALKESLGLRDGVARALGNIGWAHYEQGEYDKALDYYRRSQKIFEAIGGKEGFATGLTKISDVYKAKGEHALALDFGSRAVALAREIGLVEILWEASATVAAAHRGLNKPAEARRALEEAIAQIETLRSRVAGSGVEQQRFFESRVSPYHSLIELLVDQGDLHEAFAFSERAKSRALLDILHGGRSNPVKSVTADEEQKELALTGRVSVLNKRLYSAKLLPAPDPARLTQLESELQRARLELEAFQNNLYAAHPELRVQRGEAEPLKAGEAEALLPGLDTALLEFVVAEEKTFLFVLTKQPGLTIEVYPLAIKQSDLAGHVERFRQMLAGADNRFPKAARELYNLLLQPAAKQLGGRSRLVIVPDGALWELPMQALQTPQGRYLIEDRTISYVPSFTVLREMIGSRAGSKRPAASSLWAMGNPTLGQEAVAKVNAVLMDEKLEPLPEAERQVRSLERIYGGERARVYVGAEAREERFKAEAGKYGILHLATHGILNDRNPMYSHLLLAQAAEGKEDGLLEAWELMKLDLKADLAVLSACETARGRVGKGEGMIGLTWALFAAGVPTTVVSQWKVRSDSTAELMVEFHRRLRLQRGKAGLSAATALREAALKVKADKRYRHPFHWAGFVVVGDGY